MAFINHHVISYFILRLKRLLWVLKLAFTFISTHYHSFIQFGYSEPIKACIFPTRKNPKYQNKI